MGGEVRSPVNSLADRPLTSWTPGEEGGRMRCRIYILPLNPLYSLLVSLSANAIMVPNPIP